MDGERFDQMSRELAGAMTRRRLLRGLIGAVAVGTVFSPVKAEASAKPGKCVPGSKCKTDKQCCGALCCNETCCSAGQTCLSSGCCNKTCGSACCPNEAGWECCSGACINTNEDQDNCGGCGRPCPSTSICDQGSCRCPAPTQVCNGQCIDPQTDNDHCGGCPGNPCDTQAGEVCCDGACIDPQFDRVHCGGCPGTDCGASECCKGACLTPCVPGAVRTDDCFCVCAAGVLCSDECCPEGYACVPDSDTGALDCCPPDRTNTSANMCCSPEEIVCGSTCCGPLPLICCGTTCVNIDVDDQNCGACGNACRDGQVCNGFGMCACPQGQEACPQPDRTFCCATDAGYTCCPPDQFGNRLCIPPGGACPPPG